jgi:hypothetical protein
MISISIIPTDTKVVIEIPKEMVNKPIHVEIRPETDAEHSLPEPDPEKLTEMKAYFDQFQIDFTGFKFDREEANER